MKTATLLQSFLLAAGLMLGGIPAVQADRPHSDAPAHGNYHNLQHNKHGSGHTPWWSSSRHGKHNPKNHGNHGRDNGLRYRHWLHDRHGDHGDRWKHGKYDGHGDGHDHKDYKKHGKREGWDDAGRKGHRSRSSGIRYTGRS